MAIHDEKLYKLTMPYCIELFDNGTAITLLNRNYKPLQALPNQQQQFFRNYRDYAFKLEKPMSLTVANRLCIYRKWNDMEFAERRIYLYQSCTDGALTSPKEWAKYQKKLALLHSLPLAITGQNNSVVFYG